MASVAGLTEPECCSVGLPLLGLGTSSGVEADAVFVVMTAGFLKGKGVGLLKVTGANIGTLGWREPGRDCDARDMREEDAEERDDMAEKTEYPDAEEMEVAMEL